MCDFRRGNPLRRHLRKSGEVSLAFLSGHALETDPSMLDAQSDLGARTEEKSSQTPNPLPQRRWIGTCVLGLIGVAGAAVPLVLSPLASYLFCKAIICLLNGIFCWKILYPLQGSLTVDIVGALTAVIALGVLACVGLGSREPVLRAINWRVGPPQDVDGLWWYEKERFDYSDHGLVADFFFRLWTVLRIGLFKLLFVAVGLHVGMLVLIVCGAILIGLALLLSVLFCSLAIWVLNLIPGVAIPFPFDGSWIVNTVTVIGIIPAIVVIVLASEVFRMAAEEHPFITGVFVGTALSSSRDSSNE